MDVHTQYLLADGTRDLAGPMNMGDQALTNVNITSGVISGLTNFTVDNVNINGSTINCTAGNLTITAAGGSIFFGNEHLSTDGNISGANVRVNGILTSDDLTGIYTAQSVSPTEQVTNPDVDVEGDWTPGGDWTWSSETNTFGHLETAWTGTDNLVADMNVEIVAGKTYQVEVALGNIVWGTGTFTVRVGGDSEVLEKLEGTEQVFTMVATTTEALTLRIIGTNIETDIIPNIVSVKEIIPASVTDIEIGNAVSGVTSKTIINKDGGDIYLVGDTRIGSEVTPTVALDVTGAGLFSTTLGVTGLTTATGGIVSSGDITVITDSQTAISARKSGESDVFQVDTKYNRAITNYLVLDIVNRDVQIYRGGADQLRTDNDFRCDANFGLGIAPDSAYKQHLYKAFAGTGIERGLNVLTTFTPTASATGEKAGIGVIAQTGSGQTFANLTGAFFDAEHLGTNTVTSVVGMRGKVNLVSSGDINSAKGIQALVQNLGTGTIASAYGLYANGGVTTGNITDYYGVYIVNPYDTGVGVITNVYGLYIPSLTSGGTLNYAIYTNSGKVRFGDETTIGDDANNLLISSTGNVLLPAGAAAVGRYPIKFQSGTLLTAPENGVMEYYDGRFYLTGASARRVISRGSDSIVTPVTVHTTDVKTTVYTATLPADTFKAGKVYEIYGYGKASTFNAASTLTITLELDGNVLTTLDAVPGLAADDPMHFKLAFTVRTIGGTGTVSSHGDIHVKDTEVHTNTSSTVIDTTAVNAITVTFKWSASNAGNTATLDQAFLKLNN